jgi:hypothetical protein
MGHVWCALGLLTGLEIVGDYGDELQGHGMCRVAGL